MARKSAWQQFGDNFESTYGAFNKMFQGMETAGIMREKPEEEIIQEGPQNRYDRATGNWTYGGQTYDAPISDEKLTGLRNTRLTNVMTKYGDIKGGMDLQLRQKELEQKTLANELERRTLESKVTSAEQGVILNEQKMEIGALAIEQAQSEHQLHLNTLDAQERIIYARAAGLELDNKGQVIAVAIQKATKWDVIRGIRLGVEAQDIANSNAELAGIGLKIDNEGNLIALDIAKATKDFKIEGERLDNARKILDNIGIKITNSGALLDLEKSKALHQQTMINDALKLEVEEQELKSKQAYNQVYATYAERAALEPGTEGAFETQEDANAFLLDGLSRIDPELAMELTRKYETNEIAGITHQGTVLKQKSMLALQKGGIDGLAKEIDEMNGVDVMVKVTRDGNVVTLDEVTPDGKYIRTIASGDETTGEFMKNLDMSLDPANMMDTAKDYYDTLKKQADLAYTEASTKKIEEETKGLQNVTKELKKDAFFIQMLVDNPNDTMAWAGLVGMDLSMEEIEEKVIERTTLNALDNAGNGDNIDETKGLVENGDVVTQVDQGDAELIAAEELVQNKGLGDGKQGSHPVSEKKMKEAEALIEANTPANLNARIKVINAELLRLSKIPRQGAAIKALEDELAIKVRRLQEFSEE